MGTGGHGRLLAEAFEIAHDVGVLAVDHVLIISALLPDTQRDSGPIPYSAKRWFGRRRSTVPMRVDAGYEGWRPSSRRAAYSGCPVTTVHTIEFGSSPWL
ncbi:MAG: hypothetical protein QOJ29_398 [Thermoleophilaceae bacterium]|nr:hypothetical protein [Thermoleophilaceae bacterium]